jgi:hypothetical protein
MRFGKIAPYQGLMWVRPECFASPFTETFRMVYPLFHQRLYKFGDCKPRFFCDLGWYSRIGLNMASSKWHEGRGWPSEH